MYQQHERTKQNVAILKVDQGTEVSVHNTRSQPPLKAQSGAALQLGAL